MTAFVRATGACLPEGELSNADLERIVDTREEWITTRTGIQTRRRVTPGEATSDLATRAARAALDQAGLGAGDVDLIVCATASPDMLMPSAANLVQRNLRCGRPIPSFDVNAACAGFVYGLEVTCDMLASGRYRRALLIGADALTRFMDYQDRSTCVLFGDGAGAVLLEAGGGEYGVVATRLKSDGEFWDLIQIPGGGSRRPPSPYVITQREHYLRMQGRQTFKLAVQALEQAARDALEAAGWKLDEVDHVVVHQANARILDAVAERLRVPAAKLPSNIATTGNTSAASIPLLLDERNRAGALAPGDKILCMAFGAGLTWGSAALVWGAPRPGSAGGDRRAAAGHAPPQ